MGANLSANGMPNGPTPGGVGTDGRRGAGGTPFQQRRYPRDTLSAGSGVSIAQFMESAGPAYWPMPTDRRHGCATRRPSRGLSAP
jgi:hypothetical protein